MNTTATWRKSEDECEEEKNVMLKLVIKSRTNWKLQILFPCILNFKHQRLYSSESTPAFPVTLTKVLAI